MNVKCGLRNELFFIDVKKKNIREHLFSAFTTINIHRFDVILNNTNTYFVIL